MNEPIPVPVAASAPAASPAQTPAVPRVVLDPTNERAPADRQKVDRPGSLVGLTVGLLDISKARGDVFLDRLDTLLSHRGVRTLRFAKPTFTKPAPVDLRHEIATKCDVIIEALAD